MFRICLDDDCHDLEECGACERNALIICFLINALMFTVELYYGLISHSASLLGDSAHNIGDALILLGSIFVMSSSLIVKAKVALLKAIIMCGFGILALWYVVQNIMTGYVPNATPITLVGIFVLIGNVASAILLLYYKNKDINLKSAYICCRNDAISSVGIIIAGILVGLTQSNVPDIVIGGGIGLLICYSAIRIFKESMDVNRNQS
jgi:Co/Zn/Cd efflux system component